MKNISPARIRELRLLSRRPRREDRKCPFCHKEPCVADMRMSDEQWMEHRCIKCGLRHWDCAECKETTFDQYMIHNELWEHVVPENKGRGLLHLACLQKRLDRPLTSSDFPPLPVNDALIWLYKQIEQGVYHV